MFETLRFFLVQGVGVLALIVLALVSVKGFLAFSGVRPGKSSLRWVRWFGVAVTLSLAVWGAYGIGRNVAAEVSFLSGLYRFRGEEREQAFENAVRAIQFQPGNIRYWKYLTSVKMSMHQFSSALEDRPVYLKLGRGSIEVEDRYRFASCHYFLEDYELAVADLKSLAKEYPYFPAAQMLLGVTYTAQKNYRQAEEVLLALLQRFPSHQIAVEGLARVLYLQNRNEHAVRLLEQTRKVPFSPAVRKHFDELILLYGK